MVQLMSTKKPPVKIELQESLEDQLGPLPKRCKLDSSFQMIPSGSSLCNPLDEPSPLGLRLKKSPSFLDLIQMKLSEGNNAKKNYHKVACGDTFVTPADKLKASNFPALLLKIGNWEYKSRYEGDLVGKCYFAKHKLVWEVLDGGLKNKIEIQWSDIVAIKANFPDDGPETLDVVLARQPLFFRETNPQPRKHTLWQATSDFTGGEASKHKHHFLQCQQGFLGRHFDKLIQCDPRLNFLSRQPEMLMEPLYFERKIDHFGALNESSDACLSKATTESGVVSSSFNDEHLAFVGSSPESNSREAPSSSSDIYGNEENKRFKADGRKMPSHWDQLKVPGIQPSMSMSDLVNHIGQRISKQMNPVSPHDSNLKSSDILEEITQYLLGDSQLTLAADEHSLMSRVNSLYCLLEEDPGSVKNLRSMSSTDLEIDGEERTDNVSGLNQAPPMSRMDSTGELLLNLPRIASLPQFL